MTSTHRSTIELKNLANPSAINIQTDSAINTQTEVLSDAD